MHERFTMLKSTLILTAISSLEWQHSLIVLTTGKQTVPQITSELINLETQQSLVGFHQLDDICTAFPVTQHTNCRITQPFTLYERTTIPLFLYMQYVHSNLLLVSTN